MMATDNKALVRRTVEEVWNHGNLAAVDELYAADCVRRELDAPDTTRGVEAIKQRVTTFRNAFPDLHLTVDELIAEGERHALLWSFTGTHTGELEGIAPTGRTVSGSGISLGRIVNGKAVEEVVSRDLYGLLKQLGVLSE
jgi:steroid delta-isomerase-like uncharacterized protein